MLRTTTSRFTEQDFRRSWSIRSSYLSHCCYAVSVSTHSRFAIRNETGMNPAMRSEWLAKQQQLGAGDDVEANEGLHPSGSAGGNGMDGPADSGTSDFANAQCWRSCRADRQFRRCEPRPSCLRADRPNDAQEKVTEMQDQGEAISRLGIRLTADGTKVCMASQTAAMPRIFRRPSA